uniref:Uncharacterized protein n=1 Tax=Ralstonia syzygii R24 TaxID=907261 RepID=G3ABS2_9RALS|nr:hypothetical protein RALSY_mp30291 [Ralstonia syzygii R24]
MYCAPPRNKPNLVTYDSFARRYALLCGRILYLLEIRVSL